MEIHFPSPVVNLGRIFSQGVGSCVIPVTKLTLRGHKARWSAFCLLRIHSAQLDHTSHAPFFIEASSFAALPFVALADLSCSIAPLIFRFPCLSYVCAWSNGKIASSTSSSVLSRASTASVGDMSSSRIPFAPCRVIPSDLCSTFFQLSTIRPPGQQQSLRFFCTGAGLRQENSMKTTPKSRSASQVCTSSVALAVRRGKRTVSVLVRN